MKNKIGWCSITWNPVWGCKNHCEYCYARGVAKRFGGIRAEEEYSFCSFQDERTLKEYEEKLKNFIPVFLESQFYKSFPKKPQRIFVGSMSEIYYWKKEWMEKVIEKIRQYPQHTFLFLSKNARSYNRYIFPNNCWLGITITDDYYFEEQEDYLDDFRYKWHTFISFEPLMEEIYIGDIKYLNVDWVIIGAETGNRKGKVIPKKQWIWDIVNYCHTNNIPVYVKDSIGKLYSQFGGIKEFPEEKIR